MKTMLACLAISATLVGSAVAEISYDRKLEAAVKAQIAARIGDIRSGFDYGRHVEFVRLPDAIVTGSVMSGEQGVLAGARGSLTFPIERRATRRVF